MALFLLQNTNSKVSICAEQQIPKYNLRHCALFKAADPRIPPPHTPQALSPLHAQENVDNLTVNMFSFVQKQPFVNDFQKQILSIVMVLKYPIPSSLVYKWNFVPKIFQSWYIWHLGISAAFANSRKDYQYMPSCKYWRSLASFQVRKVLPQ